MYAKVCRCSCVLVVLAEITMATCTPCFITTCTGAHAARTMCPMELCGCVARGAAALTSVLDTVTAARDRIPNHATVFLQDNRCMLGERHHHDRCSLFKFPLRCKRATLTCIVGRGDSTIGNEASGMIRGSAPRFYSLS